ncbi:hypothetical protein [Leptospira jelokensis]|uniref:hypothetical protein n=1 Tax=Leptospira jelokensis TaxID=2484931 RepID=UPI00109136F7|nr:hypothetical protein [Leptospira jelokensis]TGM06507.1 hypothetical protein EHQ79_00680 [Leptospira jelokensis]
MHSPQTSLLISLFSGLGLLGVVVLTPVKENQVKKLENPVKPVFVEKDASNRSNLWNGNQGQTRSSEFEVDNSDKLISLVLNGNRLETQKKNLRRFFNSYPSTRLDFDSTPATYSFLDAKLSGEPALSQILLSTSTHPSTTMIFRQLESNKRTLYDPKQLYEYQGNFSATSFLNVQTSVYNVKTENPVSSYGAEGGKFSFFFGSDKIQLNVKYNYVNQRPSASNGQVGFVPTQDIASLGFIFYLGSSKNYSLYVGNQIFNVFNDPLLRVRDQNGRSPETFSASFRGKHSGNQKTTFFLNFQNQFYKDGVLYGVPGGYMVGNTFNGKSFYEYVTSLGMELAF